MQIDTTTLPLKTQIRLKVAAEKLEWREFGQIIGVSHTLVSLWMKDKQDISPKREHMIRQWLAEEWEFKG